MEHAADFEHQIKVLWLSITALIFILEAITVYLFYTTCRTTCDPSETEDDEIFETEIEIITIIERFKRQNMLMSINDVNPEDEHLGVGHFGQVVRGPCRTVGHACPLRKHVIFEITEEVAIKIALKTESQLKILREADRLLTLNKESETGFHNRIVQIKGICRHSEDQIMILMKKEATSLEVFIQKVKDFQKPRISLKHALEKIQQVAEAGVHMEENGFIHRDIADRNVLLTADSERLDGAAVKLADFGLARFIGDARTYSIEERELPVVLIPPEVFCTEKYVRKSDIWGFAIFVWQFLTLGRNPRPGLAQEIKADVLSADPSRRCLPKPAACPNSLYEVLTKCWSLDPNDRPSFAEILSFMHQEMSKFQGSDLGPFLTANIPFAEPKLDMEESKTVEFSKRTPLSPVYANRVARNSSSHASGRFREMRVAEKMEATSSKTTVVIEKQPQGHINFAFQEDRDESSTC